MSISAVSLPLPVCDRLSIELDGHEHCVFLTPRIEVDGTPIATETTKADNTVLISSEDVPDGALLVIPFRPKMPVKEEHTAITGSVNNEPFSLPIRLTAAPRFLAKRCALRVNQKITSGSHSAALRLRNDGSADTIAHVIVPQPPGLSLSGDLFQKRLENGVIALVADVPLPVYTEATLEFTIHVVDKSPDSYRVTATIGSDDHQLTLESTFTVVKTASTALTLDATGSPPAFTLGDTILVGATIHQHASPLPAATLTLSGTDIQTVSHLLGDISPHEARSLVLPVACLAQGHGTWSRPIVARLTSNGQLVASTERLYDFTGLPYLRAFATLGDTDATLARTLTINVENLGLGQAADTVVVVHLPAELRAINDSLVIDGRLRLNVDGSVGAEHGINLGTLASGATATIAFRVRSTRAITDAAITCELTCDGSSAQAVASGDFEDACRRVTADEEPAQSATPRSANGRQKPRKDAARAEAGPTSQPEPLAFAAMSSEASGSGPELGGLHQAVPTDQSTSEAETHSTVTDKPEEEPTPKRRSTPKKLVPTYETTITSMFDTCVPMDSPAELGRYVLAMYDYVPTNVSGAEGEIQHLRAELARVQERYVASIRRNTFGASGYDFTTPTLRTALNAYRDRAKLPPIVATDQRTIILGILDLVAGDAEVANDIARIRTIVADRIEQMTDDEQFGDVVQIQEAAA
ncbi:MAG: hypothetical protein ACYDHD_02655 [Vulcanimicrobiaceae bacterium]